MEESRENPSLPPNYVSILHLRDLWLKEKERNQKENELQRCPDQIRQEQKVLRSVPEENHDRKSEVAVEKLDTDRKSRGRNGSRQFQRYRRVVPASDPSTMKESCMKSVEAEGEAPLADPRNERDGKKKKKRSKKKKGGKNPRAENEEIESMSRIPEENFKEEIRETKCELGVHNVGAGGIEMWSHCAPEAGNVDKMEAVHKLRHDSVTSESKRGNNGLIESERGNNGLIRTYRGPIDGNRNFRNHQNLHSRGAHKQRVRDYGMVWVRKDVVSNGMIDGSRVAVKDTINLVNANGWIKKSG